MPKLLCIFGAIVAILLVVLFGLDLAIGVPFEKVSVLWMDVPFTILGAVLGVLSWMTLREQK
jgi:hypothetical protein